VADTATSTASAARLAIWLSATFARTRTPVMGKTEDDKAGDAAWGNHRVPIARRSGLKTLRPQTAAAGCEPTRSRI
jgi:hypothetical protein